MSGKRCEESSPQEGMREAGPLPRWTCRGSNVTKRQQEGMRENRAAAEVESSTDVACRRKFFT